MTCVKGGTGKAWKYASTYLSKSAQWYVDLMRHTYDSQTKANVQNSQPLLCIRVITAHPLHRFLHLTH